MKFLCLHGAGTSAAILRQQMISIHSRLSEMGHSLEYLDGFYTIDPTASIALRFPDGPYFTWWPEPTTENIREACNKLRDYFDKNSHTPFDAVLGFSRGAQLAASYILFHHAETPNKPLPFKTAVFICGGPVFPVLESLGVEISPEAWERDKRTREDLRERVSVNAVLKWGRDRWTAPSENGDSVLNIDPSTDLDPSNVFGFDSTKLPSHLRISIPTLHIYGRVDPRLPASMQLLCLCNPETRLVFQHPGGHNIPKNVHTVEQIMQLMDTIARRVEPPELVSGTELQS